MKLNKKYTMVEFEEIFDKSQIEALEKLDKDWEEQLAKDGNLDKSKTFTFTLQNILAFSVLKDYIFGDKDE